MNPALQEQTNNLEEHGMLHSIQSLGALDGPGLRTVVILQGCGFKCKFCHSVDTTLTDRGEEITAKALTDRILKNRPYWSKYSRIKREDRNDPAVVGGVTITGGDPAVQPEFTLALLKALKAQDVHTAVESPLHISQKIIDMWFPYVDLWMVSLKHMDNEIHQELVGRPNTLIFKNLQYLDGKISEERLAGRPVGEIRIRYVVIPDMYDTEIHMKQMGKFVSNIRNLEMFELLPYVDMGAFKWVELFGHYELDGTPNATKEDLERVVGYLEEFKLPVKLAI